MKMIPMIATMLLAVSFALPMSANADNRELAAPVIELMPHLKKLRTDLNLNDDQNKVIDNWLAEAPIKRKELEAQTIEVRAKLREALLNRDERMVRDRLKKELQEMNTRLIEMRSLCARMLHDTLTDEQYTKVVDSYRKEHKL
jgi:hypothetical protein